MTDAALQDGLYAVTDSRLSAHIPVETAVEQAINGGARLIQYREKHLRGADRKLTATLLSEVCRRHGIPLIINDDVDLAVHCGAAGVHLGRTDTSLQAAREQLGPDAIIGISCYNSLERAVDAVDNGADYVAFGRFFPSRSKPGATPADPGLLLQARQRLDVPLVAIGGITPENGRALLESGANMLAAIEGVFGQPDIEKAARSYAGLFA